jgi:hypothetical protein
MSLSDIIRNAERIADREKRSGPCEDDCEVTAPYIGILPEESDHEEGSPLDFGTYGQRSAGSLYYARWHRRE